MADFIARQSVYFTASAPTEGRINLSPKGLDSFRVLDPKHVAYLDLTGSAAETAAHLKENGRITLMFCSFAGDPLILRLYGRGRAIRPRDGEWGELSRHFPSFPGTRQIIRVEIESVQTSCGFGVPLLDYRGERADLLQWSEKKGEEGVRRYQQEKNRTSIDGKPTGLFDQ
ncbi:MAG: pyridoxamine 5'-phosphate oxidase family protein [Sulfuricellaceae bacterium]|nr:pyridoxamine 5'-phosphate oxidase family protein [Sulfuricellaceae bacterium]